MDDSQIPGADLSYADLLQAASRDDIRNAWSQLSKAADTLGLSTTTVSGFPRSATIGELIESIAGVLPVGVAIEDVMAATKTMLGRERTEVFEVRRLRHADEPTADVWVLVETFTDEQMAIKERETWANRTGDIAIVVLTHTVIERDTVMRPTWV